MLKLLRNGINNNISGNEFRFGILDEHRGVDQRWIEASTIGEKKKSFGHQRKLFQVGLVTQMT